MALVDRSSGGDAVATPADRILAWAASRPQRVFGHNPWQLGAHVLRTALRHRVTGPAAEMSFFAMLTLVPLTVAVGAALGQIQRFVGPEKIARGQDAAISLVRVVISPRLTDGVVDPFVRAQLDQQKGGAAIGGLLLTWWLAGRLFAATSRALDTAYHEQHQRLSMSQRLIALGFAFGSVVVVVLTLGIMVDAPFLDEQRDLALEFGISQALVTAWYIGRWPVVLLVLVAFLLCLYRFAPSVRHAWRHLLPGAALGVLLWILAAVAFRIYLAFGSGAPTGVVVNDARVVIIGQAVGAVVATVLWTYFSSVAILVGNELNAELARLRDRLH
ncbi:MAG TPA: YihY/virulence factor BrkB family protein [Actinomycetota bacterium]|nr:YihY/virulence factor BrkB family protein [Actinomycetota bacterium]